MAAGILLVLAGCGSSEVVSKRADTLPPPEVAAAFPAPRSTAVPYDTPIHVDFATAMDASTMTGANVFLKLDTQRVPIAVSWNAATWRLSIVPLAQLALRRTYTIELGAGIRTAEGTGFAGGGWFYQFTTNGERRPTSPRPAPGTTFESPFVMVAWDSTEISAGSIRYEIWSGLDSSAVAVRAGTPTATVTRARWLPTTAWPVGQRVYWAISVVNATIGETLHGPVQSFETVPSGLPIDSVLVKSNDSGYNLVIGTGNPLPYQYCAFDSTVSTLGTQGWFRFPFVAALPPNVRIANVRIEAYTFNHYVSRLPNTLMVLWSAQNEWPAPCRPSYGFPEVYPQKDLPVATGRHESDRRLIYMSDLLAAHVEATVRYGGHYGYEFVSTQRLAYANHRHLDPAFHPSIKIQYYVLPPTAALARTP